MSVSGPAPEASLPEALVRDEGRKFLLSQQPAYCPWPWAAVCWVSHMWALEPDCQGSSPGPPSISSVTSGWCLNFLSATEDNVVLTSFISLFICFLAYLLFSAISVAQGSSRLGLESEL